MQAFKSRLIARHTSGPPSNSVCCSKRVDRSLRRRLNKSETSHDFAKISQRAAGVVVKSVTTNRNTRKVLTRRKWPAIEQIVLVAEIDIF